MNGLRQVGDVLAERGHPRREPHAPSSNAPTNSPRSTRCSSAVLAARGRKYLMMNAPGRRASATSRRSCPSLESPTVIPLAHDGMIAIHSVVGADEVWGLLPRLKAAGASGILVLPIEKIVP